MPAVWEKPPSSAVGVVNEVCSWALVGSLTKPQNGSDPLPLPPRWKNWGGGGGGSEMAVNWPISLPVRNSEQPACAMQLLTPFNCGSSQCSEYKWTLIYPTPSHVSLWIVMNYSYFETFLSAFPAPWPFNQFLFKLKEDSALEYINRLPSSSPFERAEIISEMFGLFPKWLPSECSLSWGILKELWTGAPGFVHTLSLVADLLAYHQQSLLS